MPIRISQQPPVIAVSAADALNRDLPLSKFVGNEVRLVFSPAVEGITDAGMGTLYITTKNIMFYNSTECISIDYPTITIHAISRGDNDRLVRKPCIYCQLDVPIQDQGDGVDVVPEMRLVPNDDTCLDDLFLSLNECAALNPDPTDDQAFDEMEEQFQGVSPTGLSAEGLRNMQHLENLLQQSLDRQESDESEIVDHAQDWLIKLNTFSTQTKDIFKCPLLFDGLSRFLYSDKLLEFVPTRPANRRKKPRMDQTHIRLESSQKVNLFKAMYNKQPAVLLRWAVNGKHLYYLFDHQRMISIDMKTTQNRPALSPNVPRKAVLLELKNCIEDVNKWLPSPAVDDLLINSVEGVLVREACLEREACFSQVESDLMKYDENWKQFISKVGNSDSSPDEIAQAYKLISSQFVSNYKWKASAYDHEQQLEWDKELHEIINQELCNDEKAWLTLLEKLKLNQSIKGFHKYLLK